MAVRVAQLLPVRAARGPDAGSASDGRIAGSVGPPDGRSGEQAATRPARTTAPILSGETRNAFECLDMWDSRGWGGVIRSIPPPLLARFELRRYVERASSGNRGIVRMRGDRNGRIPPPLR